MWLNVIIFCYFFVLVVFLIFVLHYFVILCFIIKTFLLFCVLCFVSFWNVFVLLTLFCQGLKVPKMSSHPKQETKFEKIPKKISLWHVITKICNIWDETFRRFRIVRTLSTKQGICVILGLMFSIRTCFLIQIMEGVLVVSWGPGLHLFEIFLTKLRNT